MPGTPLSRFRLVALLEGLSYLVLVGIGMPLKYLADLPQTVQYVGWVHGGLFVLYMLLLVHVFFADRWSIVKGAIAFVAALIPGGALALDLWLRKPAGSARTQPVTNDVSPANE